MFGFTFHFARHLDEFSERKPGTVKAANPFVFCDVWRCLAVVACSRNVFGTRIYH